MPRAFVIVACALLATGSIRAQEIEFNRDIRPILSENCFQCHGPDSGQRKAGLRLDQRDSALADSGAGTAIVPGKPAQSLLVARINEARPSRRMPPARSGRTLTPQQIDLLTRWVAQGAGYQRHWSFIPPKRWDLPRVKTGSWPANGIDHFVLERLEKEGLQPSPRAARETLLRRVTFDLTGLPPTPGELHDFLADRSAEAYDKVVDRLLESPRFGERMALHWLDLARYADTNGYNNDEERSMWLWRDWVIDAFNENMPFDRFLTEQLAGDLLPGATNTQKIATAFNRNHVITTEGGIFPEEYRVEYVADRVHTTATVFLGLSMQCARCHDHKYDPISMKDYYRFFAFFNNVEDKTIGYNQGAAAAPFIKAPSKEQKKQLAALETHRHELAARLRMREQQASADAARWEQGLSSAAIAGLATTAAHHFPFDDGKGDKVLSAKPAGHVGQVNGKPRWTPGKIGGALELDGQTHVEAGSIAGFDRSDPFTLGLWVFPIADTGALLSKMDEDNAYRGYDLLLERGKIVVHLIHHWADNAIKIIGKQPLTVQQWHHVLVSYDGSGKAAGLTVYVDGKPSPFDVHTDKLSATIHTAQPLRLGLRTRSLPFQGKLDDLQIFRLALSPADAMRLAAGKPVAGIAELLTLPLQKRSAEQRRQINLYYLENVDVSYRKLQGELSAVAGREAEVKKAMPLTMVMAELPTPRQAHILKRGQYDQPGEAVSLGVPAALSKLPADAPRNRLGLARWLVDPAHPLTARVAVNRWWEMLFGIGIVETVEDFGAQGAWPSHPELLDWLATELIRNRWDVKATMKLIVASATYRQSSHATRALHDRDPKNRLLARGPRVRLGAETIRDNALAISGLLREKVGGPSVKPYQPEGLWEDVSVERRAIYKKDKGEGLYRRSMYTYWKRTCPPPGMTTFDAPDRETCTIRRARTNTPLQALLLLNDTTYLEAARKFAERIHKEGGTTLESRLRHAYRLALSRLPRPEEAELLLSLHGEALEKFRRDPKAATKLLSHGDAPRDASLNVAELAAWTTVASTILNLDEAITKE
ncbi:MAG: DUF1553 domain-containing protein [Planctomycetes bacterium]|nr:DUF1553 domain-containing protein [Planctomycetota bacterium]